MGFWQSIRSHFGFDHRDLPDQGEDPSTEEVATRHTQQIDRFLNWLPNPDKILQKTGKKVEHLRELLYDEEVFLCARFLRSALREHSWEIRHEDQEERVELVRSWLRTLDWSQVDSMILRGQLFGYQPIEVMWTETSDGWWMPSALVGKPAEWFAFTPDNELALKDNRMTTSSLSTVTPAKFLLPRYEPTYQNPYGQAVLSRTFWPSTFKKGDIKFLITFVERFGMPHAVGKHPRGEDKEQIDKLLNMLEGLVQDSVAAVPDDSSIEFLDHEGRQGSSEVYLNVARYFDRKINKVMVGTELATGSGEHGTYSLGVAQIEQISGAIVSDLCELKEETMNDLLHWIWHFNGWPEPVPDFNCYLEEEVGQERAERDNTLTSAGVQFKKPYFQRTYNLDEDEFEVVPPSAGQGEGLPFGMLGRARNVEHLSHQFAQFQEQHPETDVDELVEAASGEAEVNQALMEDLLEEPMQLVRDGATPQEVMTALARAYPQLDASQLEERLRSLFFAAEMWGRVSAQGEADEAGAPTDDQLEE